MDSFLTEAGYKVPLPMVRPCCKVPGVLNIRHFIFYHRKITSKSAVNSP
jgi:hypothetical protein